MFTWLNILNKSNLTTMKKQRGMCKNLGGRLVGEAACMRESDDESS